MNFTIPYRKFLLCAFIFLALSIKAQNSEENDSIVTEALESIVDTQTGGFQVTRNKPLRIPIDEVEPIGPVTPDDPAVPVDPPIASDKTLTVDPMDPGLPTLTSSFSVGMTPCEMNVTSSGAAAFSILLNCPNGGSLSPDLSLIYNSHNTSYGLAGYGFSISGLSVITHGEKTLFNNNGVMRGVDYSESDNLFLDGQRLILQSGSPLTDGAIYCLEGNPYTVITVHGHYASTSPDTWFEVKTNDGKTYYYGNTTDSKITFTANSGHKRIASWHVNRIEDQYHNYLTYTYNIRNFYAYPVCINYGLNSVKNRGLLNTIELEYCDLGVFPGYFNIGGQQGYIDRRIASISIKSNETLYRKYMLEYDTTSDKSTIKYARLVKVTEENGSGKKYKPTELDWKFLPSENWINMFSIEDPTPDTRTNVKSYDKVFFSADLNGDGISDIIRLSPVIIETVSPSLIQEENRDLMYISKSKVTSTGKIEFEDPYVVKLSSTFQDGNFKQTVGLSGLMDFDGDGFNDVMVSYSLEPGNYECFFYISGYNIANDIQLPPLEHTLYLKTKNSKTLTCNLDADGDGKDEVLVIENAPVGGSYPIHILEYKENSIQSLDKNIVYLNLPKKPEKFFCGDFNNDGLSDLILLYDGGYKIFFNNGGNRNDVKFSDANSKTGTNMGDCWRIEQGDFNGDGLIDFVYNISGETWLWIGINNGDGTFSLTKSDDIGVPNNKTNKDDSQYVIKVLDINHDGKSDVFISKARYEYHGGLTSAYRYEDTHIKWLVSDGTSLKLKNSIIKKREADANEKSVFTGDFDGDGYVELANYGSDLTTINTSFYDNKLNIYSTYDASPDCGRIMRMKDGMGNETTVFYGLSTSPRIYSRETPNDQEKNINIYTLPFPVVWQTQSPTGANGPSAVQYKYTDFKVHLGGAGALGFSQISTKDFISGENTLTRTTSWNEEFWIPIETQTLSTIGDMTTSTHSKNVVEKINGTYVSNLAETSIIDIYGNSAITKNKYDITKGVILEQTITNDSTDMYKKVIYSGYQKKAGMWVPTSKKQIQKHIHDSQSHSTETRYTYDDQANVVATTIRYGTDMALTTSATYDAYGNRLSSVDTGKSVVPVTKYNIYDPTGRFVIKSYQSPEGAVNTFTYDNWGNVLKEIDETDNANPLITLYSYDSWGQLISTTLPDGRKTTYSSGWGATYGRNYYTLTTPSDSPWILTYFDKGGRETFQKTFGPKNVLVSTSTSYDSRNRISKVEKTNGKLNVTETFTYDALGRIISDSISSGKVTTYTYGNRTITTSSNGKSSTKTTDAWDNLLTSTDAVGGEVTYTYGSNGLPLAITSVDTKVSMSYDAAGNRVSLDDPDAGTSYFDYSADGAILQQTDARGVTSEYSYDNLGRVIKVKMGNQIIEYTYGTSGFEKMRLIKRVLGNNKESFNYDKYGRVIKEIRVMEGGVSSSIAYTYDNKSRLSKLQVPGFPTITYSYDNYGQRIAVKTDEKTLIKLKDYTGLKAVCVYLDSITLTKTLDADGFESTREAEYGNKLLDKIDLVYNKLTGNLIEMTRLDYSKEKYLYDNLDRLIGVGGGIAHGMELRYNRNGNIAYKTGLGFYSYKASHPHAVVTVDNSSNILDDGTLWTTFNDLNRIEKIQDRESSQIMEFDYGPDIQRWTMTLKKLGITTKKIRYHKFIELIAENNEIDSKKIFYLDDNLLFINNKGECQPYFVFKDQLGSFLSAFDAEGEKVFEAAYDAWGRQDIKVNSINLLRGYTGHEMLNEFGLINMNGRLYDPITSRFLSPDPFVQFPDFSQSYNRYSYCLNNPLKYTDPTGNIAEWVLMGLFHAASGMMQAAFFGGDAIDIYKAGFLNFWIACNKQILNRHFFVKLNRH